MTKRAFSWTVAALLLPSSLATGAEGFSIEHKPVKCIIVGKFPKLNACYAPAGALARGRLYFRPEGAPNWYYVDTAADNPCQAGVLPKATKKLLGKHVEYHFQGVDKSFAEALTENYAPIVVASEQECKGQPIAAIASKGPAAVFPGVPAAMAGAGGVNAAVVAAGIGAAGATTAVVASSGGGNNTTTLATTPTGGGSSTVAVTTVPATTAPPATPPPAPQLRCVPAFSINPDPPEGPDPLRVTFDMCATVGGSRKFFYDFDGDGTIDFRGPTCSASRTYTFTGVSSSGMPTTIRPSSITYFATVKAGCEDQGVFQSQTYEIKVTRATFTVKAVDSPASPRRLALGSQLDVPQARGQIVVNGTSVVYASSGRSMAVAQGVKGDNRIEAQLVQGGGAGTWRFDLAATGTFEPGSLRVIAGEVVVVTADAVVFRLSGKPGERVVFAFRASR